MVTRETPLLSPLFSSLLSPTALNSASHLMMCALGMDVFKNATSSAIDSAGWWRPIEAAWSRGWRSRGWRSRGRRRGAERRGGSVRVKVEGRGGGCKGW
jgi:hypothetical protein